MASAGEFQPITPRPQPKKPKAAPGQIPGYPASAAVPTGPTVTAPPAITPFSPYVPTAPPRGDITPMSFTPAPMPTAQDLYGQYSQIFGPPHQLNPMQVARDIQSLFSANQPNISAPIAIAPTVNIPGGGYGQMQEAMFNAQFAPVERALEKQATRADTALAGNLANAGLADSGSGVSQRAQQTADYDQRITDAATDISQAASAQRWTAQIAVEQQNAQMQLQVSLANAGFDLTAQQFNAQQLLNGNSDAAKGYLAALGINAQQAESYRNGFMQFMGIRGEQALNENKLKFDVASALFNQRLQSRALDLQAWQTGEQAKLASSQQGLDANISQNSLALDAWKSRTAADANAYANATQRMDGINNFNAKMAGLNQEWKQFQASQAQQASQFAQAQAQQQAQYSATLKLQQAELDAKREADKAAQAQAAAQLAQQGSQFGQDLNLRQKAMALEARKAQAALPGAGYSMGGSPAGQATAGGAYPVYTPPDFSEFTRPSSYSPF